MWCRVFGILDATPMPEEFYEYLRGLGRRVQGQVEADELGWFQMELVTEAGAFNLERYLASEGIRDELNAWAAWLEQHAGERAEALMLHMISTRQLVTLRRKDLPAEQDAAPIHEAARWLAQRTGGIYQIDGQGFFDAMGNHMVEERER